MKKLFLLAISFVCALNVANAQIEGVVEGTDDENEISVMDGERKPVRKPVVGVFEKTNISTFKEPIPYVSLREADVMYSTIIWRKIDLREKLNHPLYYPTVPQGDWRNLFDVILDAMNSTENPLPIYTDEFCNIPMNQTELTEALKEKTLEKVEYDEYGNEIEGTKTSEALFFTSKNVKAFNIKEEWFFDKQRSVQEVRIIAINPLILYQKEMEGAEDLGDEEDSEEATEISNILNETERSIGWILFDELRPFLAKKEVFNRYNHAARVSYDDIFWKRMFNSIIVAEENVYNNRTIDTYRKNPFDQVLEAEIIKNKLFVKEHDLWEF